MKKISIFLLSVLICFSFLGCNNEKQTQVNGENYKSSTLLDESEAQTDKEKNEEKKETENSENTKSQRKTENDSKSSGEKSEEKSGGNDGTKSGEKSGEKATAKKSSTTKEKTTTKSTVTCSVTIECTVILKNEDKLEKGHESYVPSNGYFAADEKVTLKKGSTAYDAVKEVCNEKGIKISTTGSGKSVYIAGFNNIDQFDCGSGSGWTYYVNGSFPSKSCGAYTLSDGDSIEFIYVC